MLGSERCSRVINSGAVCSTLPTRAFIRTHQNNSLALDRPPPRSAFKLDRRLPASVRGPVDFEGAAPIGLQARHCHRTFETNGHAANPKDATSICI